MQQPNPAAACGSFWKGPYDLLQAGNKSCPFLCSFEKYQLFAIDMKPICIVQYLHYGSFCFHTLRTNILVLPVLVK